MNLQNAKSLLNEYRNQNYNSTFRDENELAQAIDKVLPRLKKVEELLRLYELKDEMEKQFGYDYPYENIWKQINAIKEELK